MHGKQNTGSRFSLLLGMLFLFINFTSVAAPFVKSTNGLGEPIPRSFSSEVPGSGESEDGNQPGTTSYVSYSQHIGLRRQANKLVVKTCYASHAETKKFSDRQHQRISAAAMLPRPGYYAFLFRHNLF